LVTIKRCGGEFLKRSLGKIPSQTLSKTTATARADDDTTIVGVYIIILPSNCMRRAYYRKKPRVAEFWIQINFYPKIPLGPLKIVQKNGAMSFRSITIIIMSEPYYY
jgi:hypothetical protein